MVPIFFWMAKPFVSDRNFLFCPCAKPIGWLVSDGKYRGIRGFTRIFHRLPIIGAVGPSPCADFLIKIRLARPTRPTLVLLYTTSSLKKTKKVPGKFGYFTNYEYLCTRKYEMVPWMSGLVNGLQNRQHPFESGRHLAERFLKRESFFVTISSETKVSTDPLLPLFCENY